MQVEVEVAAALRQSGGRERSRLVGTLIVAGCNMAALGSSRLIVPMLALALGANAFLIGVIVALFTAAPMVLSVSFGRWMDRAGTLPAILFSALMVVLASVVFLLFQSKYALLVVAALVGTAGVFTHMAATRAVGAGGEGARRAKYLGYLVLSYSLFNFMGPVIVSHAYQHYGASSAIASLGGFAVLSILGTVAVTHHFRRDSEKGLPAQSGRRAYDLLKHADLRLWILISSIFTANQTLYPFLMSLHAVEVGLTASQAGWMLGAFALGTLTSRFFTPVLVKRFRPDITLVVALIFAVSLYALIPLARDTYALAILSAGLGLPLGVGAPVSLAIIYETAPEGRVNESLGISMAVNNLLQTIFPLLMGAMAADMGTSPMVWGWAVVMACAAIITLKRSRLVKI